MFKNLAPLAAALALLCGCASTQTAVNKAVTDLNTANTTINQVSSALTTTAATISTAAATTAAALNTVVDSSLTAANAVASLSLTAETVSAELNPANYGNYTVISGDTLWAISCREFGNCFYWPMLVQQNALTNPNLIVPGQNIRYAKPALFDTYSTVQINGWLATAYAAPD